MQEWVRHDLVDKGCATRMVLRWTVPCVVILAPLLLIPTTLYVHAGMTVPILIPFVYFAMALNRTWRRHRLAQHGLDPTLADARLRAREADQRLAYERRYGGR